MGGSANPENWSVTQKVKERVQSPSQIWEDPAGTLEMLGQISLAAGTGGASEVIGAKYKASQARENARNAAAQAAVSSAAATAADDSATQLTSLQQTGLGTTKQDGEEFEEDDTDTKVRRKRLGTRKLQIALANDTTSTTPASGLQTTTAPTGLRV